MASRKMTLTALLAAVLWASSSVGQGTPPADSPLFASSEPLTLRLEAPWRELTRRMATGRARDGVLSYISPEGETISLDVRLVTRGKARLEECTAPMLTLELSPDQLEGTLFEGNEIVHLTAQCQVQPAFREYLTREYLAYRAYATVAVRALGARVISVAYSDPQRQRAPRPRPAFLVEDISLAAERWDMAWLHPQSSDVSALDPEAAAVFVLFQYMIGNTDWSLLQGPEGESCCHNVALVGRQGQTEQTEGLVPIPFDFDTAGLVNAEYAVPDARLRIRSTRQRLYRGFCDLNPHLPPAIERFNDAAGELRALFEQSEELTPRSKREALKYLEKFFATLNDPAKLDAEILQQCRPGQAARR